MMPSYRLLRYIHTCSQMCLSLPQRFRAAECRKILCVLHTNRHCHIDKLKVIKKDANDFLIRNISTTQICRLAEKRICWKCGRETNPQQEMFFCDCGVVQQPAKSLTFFDLMQIKKSFDIDVNELSRKFKDMQKFLHPDKFSTKSKEEQTHAEHQSSFLNEAYSTLLKPLSRSIYLLELEGITISENDSVTDPEFLMNVMEGFEKISEASNADDLHQLEQENNLKMENTVKELSAVFLKKDFLAAKNIVIKLRYFSTIDERTKEARLKGLY